MNTGSLTAGTSSALLTDLYQLTMLQGYWAERMRGPAVFEFFVRRLPARRGFLVAAGLEQVLEFLQGFAVTPADVESLRSTGQIGRAHV